MIDSAVTLITTNFCKERTDASLQDFYVDDFLGGADNEEEARQLVDELLNLMTKRGYAYAKMEF